MLETLRQCWALTSPSVRVHWWVLLLANVFYALVEVVAALGLVVLLGLMTGAPFEALPAGRQLSGIAGMVEPDRQIRFVCLLLLVVFAVKSSMGFLVMRLQNRLPLQAGNALARRLFALYLNAPYAFHLERNSAETIRNLNASVDAVYRVGGVGALTILSEGIVAGAVLAVTCWASPSESLVIVGVSVISMGFAYRRYQ
ncbi:MAG: hypothetical protein ABL907_12300, partial [Hyphomicrobium sp.]